MPDEPTSPGSPALILRHATGACPIHVGPGLLLELPRLAASYLPGRRPAVIADDRVAAIVHHRLEAPVFTFPAGEPSKTRETWAALTDGLLGAGFGRDAAIVALGGGVTGDLAGFVAATFLRGVPFLQVPTTLLAMVDASIGGKTGVDVPAGKNLVGAFHQPAAVVIDPEVLATLPREEWHQGLAEVVKHAVIADHDHFGELEHAAGGLAAGSVEGIAPVIRRSVAIKAAIVESDEREEGRRAVLNAGHTVAHAVEQVSGFRVGHGQAVAIGLVIESRLGESLGLTEPGTSQRIAGLLAALQLPTAMPETLSAERVVRAMAMDKKNRAGAIHFSIPAAIGRMRGSGTSSWTVAVPADRILAALTSLP